MTEKKIILNTFGSFGDIYPFMALALELQKRGQRPVIATMDFYREKVLNAGLEFAAVRPNIPGPKEQSVELLDKIMNPRTGPRFLMDEVIFASIRESYEDLLRISTDADLLITHPAAPAGPLVGHKTGMTWISTVLAPFSFFSPFDPPVPPFWSWGARFRVLGPRVMKRLLNLMKSGYEAEKLKMFREELSIPDYGNPIFEGQHSPTLILALFSELFGRPQPDWPKQTRTTGFCVYEPQHEPPMPVELREFLDNGPPPIVFTLGSSAVWVAQDFYTESIKAARRLNKRAVLLIGDDRNRPEKVPNDMIAVDYAQYGALFPRSCAVVHHGGVGTTSHGLVAGVPTLIVPFAFDQSDNADRARRLGTSRTLYRKKYDAASAARELASLIDKTYVKRASEVSQQLQNEDGPRRASDLIEQVLAAKRERIEEPAYAFGN